MKRLLSVLVAVVFVTGVAGFAVAQTSTTTPEKKAEGEKKMDKAAGGEKKMAAKSARGTVKSAAADSLVVAGKEKGKEAEWTFAVDPSTKIKKGGKDITAADVKPGDSVSVRYMEKDGKPTAQTVMVSAGSSKKTEKASGEMKPAEKPAEKK